MSENKMPTYQPGDCVKVEFRDEPTEIGEWMWIRVINCDGAGAAYPRHCR
jgi:hypothetical protein